MIGKFLDALGAYMLMLKNMFSRPENMSVYWKRFMQDCYTIGIRSLPLISLIGLCLGIIMVLQSIYLLGNPMVPKAYIAMGVRETMLLELGPAGIAALLADVVGFSITFDIGRSRLREQIDALEVMGVNVESFFVLPKIAAGLLLIPFLIILATAISLFGGWVYCVFTHIILPGEFLNGLSMHFKIESFRMLLIKSYAFAFLIPSVAAYLGLSFHGNIEQLSRRATFSITLNCVLILSFDYIITTMMIP